MNKKKDPPPEKKLPLPPLDDKWKKDIKRDDFLKPKPGEEIDPKKRDN
jgi:hypothetical protein